MLLGLLSKSDMIVAPVVVIPDMLSKKASLNEKVWFDNKKGKLPKIATVTHASVENKKVCLRFNFKFFSRFANMHKIPINIVTKEDEIKLWLFSLYITCIEYGASIESPSTMSNTPIKKKTVLLLVIKNEII